ncbi:MAG TPA: tRNA dihydrouridine(20/20a) synthase DusA [Acidithiobacillus sp.]|nr:tRNA dihydrouridine(20/20a) synthase DusA [Acidithiobacillus sp.]
MAELNKYTAMDKILSVAPMLDWTDRHCRYFLRLVCPSCVLYTEMVTTSALLLGRDPERFLEFSAAEHPLILQLGGDDPAAMRAVAAMAHAYGYDGLNLNVGCPSPRVQKGRFGACLMATPELVAELVAAMGESGLPVSVKHRLGLDREEDYAALRAFIETVAVAGCRHFIVHARNAWLQGLSPAENRDVPPLRWDWVYQLKKELPHLTIEINGGFNDLAAVTAQFSAVDGVMIGRAAYHHPLLLAEIERAMGRRETLPEPEVILSGLIEYAEQWGEALPALRLSRHLHGLRFGQNGAGAWRHFLGTAELGESAAEFLRRGMSLLD